MSAGTLFLAFPDSDADPFLVTREFKDRLLAEGFAGAEIPN
jgi:hypothetical protein